MSGTAPWLVFAAIFIILLALDLFFIGRREKPLDVRKAACCTAVYILVAVLFGVYVCTVSGIGSAASYYAVYLVELSMSVDNLFVFIILFSMFAIPGRDQHRVLFWGILGAVAFRAVFIAVGVEAMHEFHSLMYVFGALLIYIAVRTVRPGDRSEVGRNDSLPMRVCRRIRATDDLSSRKFFTVENGRRVATPLFLCLVAIELSDLMFAFDSLPAALSITDDVFVILTAGLFAVMGLRSMYFVVKDMLVSLEYLKYGLGAILAFIGVKMLLSASGTAEISVTVSLGVIVLILAVTVVFSLVKRKRTDGRV